jgi:hypothetical protein
MKTPSTQKRSEKAFVYGTALWFICKNGTTIDKILAFGLLQSAIKEDQ